MTENVSVRCPGCGLVLPSEGLPSSERYHAAGECFARYGELCGRTLSSRDPDFGHQHAVDAYAAQHAGGPARSIGLAYALIGLCLHLEHGLSGRQVQQVHMRIPKREWPSLEPPDATWDVTVMDVLESDSDAQRHSRIEAWADSVWRRWNREHDRIRACVSELLGTAGGRTR